MTAKREIRSTSSLQKADILEAFSRWHGPQTALRFWRLLQIVLQSYGISTPSLLLRTYLGFSANNANIFRLTVIFGCCSTFDINTSSDTSDNQQIGNLWQGDWLLSASLSGHINYLDKNSGKVSRSIEGHARPITSLAVTKEDTLFTGSYGRVCSWSMADGDETKAQDAGGDNCSNQVIALTVDDKQLYSVDMDDMLRSGSVTDKNIRYSWP